MTVDDVKKLIDYAEKKGLRSLRATVPNAVTGQPDVLVEFAFRHDAKQPDKRAPGNRGEEKWQP